MLNLATLKKEEKKEKIQKKENIIAKKEQLD
jgi:hypothetical protein